jgi:aarF domain-containing kinase
MYELVKEIDGVEVPRVIEELSTKQILTMEMIKGVDLDTCAAKLNQDERNYLGSKIMDVTIREIFEW